MIAAVFLAAALSSRPEVVAVVERIDGAGMIAHMQDGGIRTYTTVTLSVISPKAYAGRAVQAYCPGPPLIGWEPLLIGQRVTFRLPEKDDNVWLPDLPEFRVWQAPANSPIPILEAKRIFNEAQQASDEDEGKLWGYSLYGPMIFADPKTRIFVRENGTGGELPKDVIVANTATTIDGRLTTMISWPALRGTAVQQRRLTMHECWHRIQKEIGFPAKEADNAHLDTVDGRTWLQFELRALAAALRGRGDARAEALRDAVTFRAARRERFQQAAEAERALENNEGLAEYTGWALRGTPAEESRQAFARHLDNIDPNTSFVRGFAYETGPAYGLLLDVLKPGWTREYKATDELAAYVGQVLNLSGRVGNPPHIERYGGDALRAAEEKRDRERRERVAQFRARLVDGPTLELPMADAHYGFDPNAVTALGEAGNGYQTLDVTAAWGRISVDTGARIAADWLKIFVAAEDRAKLELKPGWKVVPGSRQGDLRVVHE